MRTPIYIAALFVLGIASDAHAGFLLFPLHCSDSSCTINYAIHGAYTADAMNSVVDHSMKKNTTAYYPYGVLSGGGGDGVITAFNGERVHGAHLPSDETCIGGTIYLHPDWNKSRRMTNDGGCGVGYSSYDEHPGYDYRASSGAAVYAAADGYVLPTTCYIGNLGGTCDAWGAIAIKHSTGYITQYLHMANRYYTANQHVSAGAQIGTVGNRCYQCSVPDHLHFEVRATGPAIGPEIYPIVDPYGWVGSGSDPLYSASYVTPKNLWK